MKDTTFIYILEDPNTGSPRYVGKSDSPRKRLERHVKEAELTDKKDHKNNWIRSLLKDNLRPVLLVVDEVPKEEWTFWERHYYDLYKSYGFDLTNVKEAIGTGTTRLTQEHKDNISKAKKGYKYSQHAKESFKKGAQKRVSNPTDGMKEAWDEFGQCWKGKKQTTEHCQKRVDKRNENNSWNIIPQPTLEQRKEGWKKRKASGKGNGLLGKKRGPYKEKKQQ